MPGYEDALFFQTEHLRFLRSAAGVGYYEAFDRAFREKEYENDDWEQLPQNITWTLASRICEGGDPIYVSPRFIEMAEYALGSFQPEPVLPTDLFTAQGFAYLPKPIHVLDVNDQELPIRAMGWIPVRAQREAGMETGGVWVVMWVHRDDDQPGLMGMDQAIIDHVRSLPFGRLTPVHSFWMPYGERYWENISDDRFADASARQWKSIQVLWRLGNQVVRTAERAPKAARKDARRHGVEADHVTVIRLRKTESLAYDPTPTTDDWDGEGRHYSVQFVVRGHWRNQWYKSLGEHRQIWISPYVKGPEDAPFQPSKRVYELTR